MFLGTYQHNLDTKNRLTIPSKIRNGLCDSIVVSKGFDGCLEIRTQVDFQSYGNQLMTLSQNKINSRTILRQLLANASELDIDSANRILIPMNLLNEAKITKNVIIIGLGNKLEVWDKEAYEEFKSNSDGLLEQLAEGIENNEPL